MRSDLCALLELSPETPALELVGARTQRLVDLQEFLRNDDLPKLVKVKIRRDIEELESPEARQLASELEHLIKADKLAAEIAAEFSKATWSPGVVELLCQKLAPLVPAIVDESERLRFEKKIVEFVEKQRARQSPQVTPDSIRSSQPAERNEISEEGSTPPHDVAARLQSYFAEISVERAKPRPARGVVRLWLRKIEALIDLLEDEVSRLSYEKRLVEVEYWLEGSHPPWGSKEIPDPVPPPNPGTPPNPVAPPRPIVKPCTGTLLQFLPKALEGTLRRKCPPIHFIARSRFILGRQRNKSDFVTWFLPNSTANQQKTDTISRVNTTLFSKGNQLWIQDGEILPEGKSKPSVGTVVDGQAITAAPLQLNFTKERTLRIGQSGYEIKAIHLPAVAPEGPLSGVPDATNTGGDETVIVNARPYGSMRFQSVSCSEVEVLPVWLFSDATIGSDVNCAVPLEGYGLPLLALRVHFWEQGFWLTLPGKSQCIVKLDGIQIAEEEAMALQSSHTLDLGALQFELKVVA